MRTAMKVMPAVWLALPVAIFAGWYATLLPVADGYAVDATAKGTATLGFIGSFCAACAAWDGSRLRRAGLWNLPSVRSRAAIAVWWLAPTIGIGVASLTVAVAVELVRAQAGVPDFRLVAVAALALASMSGAGFATGLLLPFAVAGPLAIVAPFIWFGFLPAMYPVWLRHLTSMFRDCCGLAFDLAPRAVAASVIVDVGIIAAAAVLIAGPASRARRAGLASGTLAAAALAGILLVAGMAYAPTIPRDVGHLECRTEAGTTVCLWPEHRAGAATIGDVVRETRAHWQQNGVDAPSHITEAAASVAPSNALVFAASGGARNEDQIVRALAIALVPDFPDCPYGAAGWSAAEYLQAWYAYTGGMSEASLRREYGREGDAQYPAPLRIVEQLEAAPHEIRRAWVSRAENLTQDCDNWSANAIAVQE